MNSDGDKTYPRNDGPAPDSSVPDTRRADEGDAPGAGTAGGAVGGAAAGAIAGTLIGGPVGTAVGAAIGAVGGAIAGRAVDGIDDDVTGTPAGIDPGAGGLAGPGGLGLGAGIGSVTAGAASVGGVGIPVPSGKADHGREGNTMNDDKRQGPFDNAASYDETAADVAKDRPILVGDDPGFEATGDTPDRYGGEQAGAATTGYVDDRDDIAQGGTPR